MSWHVYVGQLQDLMRRLSPSQYISELNEFAGSEQDLKIASAEILNSLMVADHGARVDSLAERCRKVGLVQVNSHFGDMCCRCYIFRISLICVDIVCVGRS